MRPSQPPPTSTATPKPARRPGRRQDLNLPLPQRNPFVAVPLPLPPNSSASSSSAAGSNSASSTAVNHRQFSFSELDRISRIGSGAGGTVYKVIHRPTGRPYALKVFHGYHDEAVRRQICREIEILRDVDNPYIVKCHDMFDQNGEIQVLLELMDGGSLEGTHIPQENLLSDLTRQILTGLAYLHRRHIVHRDIKPSNLLINRRKEVKIADFGVGRILEQTLDACNSAVGTIAYMSPERINTDLNEGVYDGYAGDIWSLGVGVLEFHLGKFPFGNGRQGDWASLMSSICMSQPPEAPPTASPEFRNFIACCLQRDPGRRWPAAQLLQHPFILRNTNHNNDSNGGNQRRSHHLHHRNLHHQNLHQLLPPPPRPNPS